jgi:hypothetical protein
VADVPGFQDLRQPEVGQPHRATDEEDVVGLDVAMLDADPRTVGRQVTRLVEEVDGAGEFLHVAKQLVARQAGLTLLPAGAEPIHQALIAQGHRDHQTILDPPGELDVEQVRMADVAQDLQRPLLRTRLDRIEADELQRDRDAAGCRGLPDLAEPAPAQQTDQRVAGDRLGTGFQAKRHDKLRSNHGFSVLFCILKRN